MDWLKTTLEFLKLTPRNITPFLFISAILLFAPREWLTLLNILDLKEEYHLIISMIFLLSSVILVNYMLFAIFSFFKKSLIRIKIKSSIRKRLHTLTEDEKQILRFYISQNTRANTLRYDDGIVKGLEYSYIIYRSSNMGNMVEGFAYNINDIAWDYLHKNYYLLEGNTNFYRTDKRNDWRYF